MPTFDKVVLVCLAIWALLFGLFAVTNIQVTWGGPIMGFAALVLGAVCLIRAFR
jgi:uncharacterized membrane protein